MAIKPNPPPRAKSQQKSFNQIQQVETSEIEQAPSRQEVLAQKYQAGKISMDEFGELFPELYVRNRYGGKGSNTKVVEAYIQYLSSKGLDTREAERSLPESGRSYRVYTGRPAVALVPRPLSAKDFDAETRFKILNSGGKENPLTIMSKEGTTQKSNVLTAIHSDRNVQNFVFKGTSGENKIPLMPVSQDSRSAGQRAQDQFFEEREAAIQRLRSQGPVQNVVGAGAGALFGAAKAVSRPQETIQKAQQAAGFAASGASILVASKDRVRLIKDAGKIAIRPFQEDFPGAVSETVVSGQLFGSLSKVFEPGANFAKTKFARAQEKYDPRFLRDVEPELLPTSTVNVPFSTLKKFEGKEIEAVHVSTGLNFGSPAQRFANVLLGKKQQTLLRAIPEGGGKFRQEVEQFSFYRSTPNPQGKPRAYLGYAGIASEQELARAKKVLTVFEPKINAFIEKVKVEPTPIPALDFKILNESALTPKARKAVRILAAQERRPGVSSLAAEDLSGVYSFPEGQITTPTFNQAFPRTGRPQSPGSILVKEREIGFKFYYQKQNLPSFIPKNIRKSIENTDFFTKAKRINFIRTKTIPAPSGFAGGNPKAIRIPISNLRSRSTIAVPISSPLRRIGFSAGVRSIPSRRRVVTRDVVSNQYFTDRVVNRKNFRNAFSNIRARKVSNPLRPFSPYRIVAPRTPLRAPPFSPPRSPPITRSPPSRPPFSPPTRPTVTRGPPGRPPSPPFSPPRGLPKRKLFQSPKTRAFGPAFKIQTKIKGKRVLLPTSYSLRDVFAAGTQELRGSLKASFREIPTGGFAPERRLSAANIPLYKNKQGFFVQRRENRLGSIEERRQIQAARRNKGKVFS